MPEDWSADGRQILCLLRLSGPFRWVLVSAETGEVRDVISSGARRVGHPRISPDHRYLVYALQEQRDDEESRRNLHLLDLETGQTNQLTFWSGNQTTPIWSPRATNVVLFSSDRFGSWDLWAIQIQDGRPGLPFIVRYSIGDHEKRLAADGTLLVHRTTQAPDGYTIPYDLPSQATGLRPPPTAPSLESTPTGIIYFHVFGKLHTMAPDGSQILMAPPNLARGQPSHALHGGHRWFLQTREVPGDPYPHEQPRQELFAVRGDGDERFTVQLTDHPDQEPKGLYVRWTRDAATGAVDGRISWGAVLWDPIATNQISAIFTARIQFDDDGHVNGLIDLPEEPVVTDAI